MPLPIPAPVVKVGGYYISQWVYHWPDIYCVAYHRNPWGEDPSYSYREWWL